MYINVSDDMQKEIDIRVENATRYNDKIYELTLPKSNRFHNHGNILKYIDEEVKTLEDMKVVFKALIEGLNREE